MYNLDRFVEDYHLMQQKYEPYKKQIIEFIDELLDNIPEDKYPAQYTKNKSPFKLFVAGGAITSVFCKREINDFDIYFYNKEDFELINSNIGWYATKVSESEKAVTYNRSGQCFQLIKLFGTPHEVFNMYDFTINMGALEIEYFTNRDKTVSWFTFDAGFFPDNSSKSLIFNTNTLYPINSLFRINKCREKGYKINTYEMMKIALRITKLKIETVKDFREQLCGLSKEIFREWDLQLDNLKPEDKIDDVFEFIEKLNNKTLMPSLPSPFNFVLPRLGINERI